tara:strand:- start:265 stop:483 length:219 start_codon:yes stop_codon:yes gene_type:complete
MTQTIEPKFICAIEENAMMLCEKHTKIFEITAMTAGVPHTIMELEDDDAETVTCHACNLHDELTRPRIIIAH